MSVVAGFKMKWYRFVLFFIEEDIVHTISDDECSTEGITDDCGLKQKKGGEGGIGREGEVGWVLCGTVVR